MPHWNVTIGPATSTRVSVDWTNLTGTINQHLVGYLVLVGDTNGTIVNTVFVSGNASHASIFRLSPYTEYQVLVIGVSSDREPYKSSHITAWTDESGI